MGKRAATSSAAEPSGAAAVKVEPVGCVNGMRGKDLANAFGKKLKHCPKDIVKYYETNLKNKKTHTSGAKLEFVKQILTNDDYQSEYYTRLQKTSHSDSESRTRAWLLWAKYSAEEGEAVAKAQVAQGSVEKRPHPKLDPEAESTLELPEWERFQYRHIVEQDSEVAATTNSVEKSPDPNETSLNLKVAEGGEAEASGDDGGEKDNKVVLREARKAYGTYTSRLVDYKTRLAKYESNEYVSKVYAEANGLLKKMKTAATNIEKSIASDTAGKDTTNGDLAAVETSTQTLNNDTTSFKQKLSAMSALVEKLSA